MQSKSRNTYFFNLEKKRDYSSLLIVFLYVAMFVGGAILILPYLNFGEDRIPIGTAYNLQDRSVKLISFWNDDQLAKDMIKSGAVKGSSNGSTVWVAGMSITNKHIDAITIKPTDFELKDDKNKTHKVLTSDIAESRLKNGKTVSGQISFFLNKTNKAKELIYYANGEKEDKLVFSVKE